jgi:hypothetical protein
MPSCSAQLLLLLLPLLLVCFTIRPHTAGGAARVTIATTTSRILFFFSCTTAPSGMTTLTPTAAAQILHTTPPTYCYTRPAASTSITPLPIFTPKVPLIFILIFLRIQQLDCRIIPARDYTPLCVTGLVIICLPLCRVKWNHLAPAHIAAADAAATWQI